MITITHLNSIKETSKQRRDGIYTKHGYAYIVKNNIPTIFMKNTGNIFQLMGHFTVNIGRIDIVIGNQLQELKRLAKENKWI